MENEWWSFSKNTWKYDIFFKFGKDGISLSYKDDITILLKKERRFSPQKNTLQDDISGITEKDDIHPTWLVFILIERSKMIKTFSFIKKFQWFSVLLWRYLLALSYFAFQWKKTTRHLRHKTEIWLLIWLAYFTLKTI